MKTAMGGMAEAGKTNRIQPQKKVGGVVIVDGVVRGGGADARLGGVHPVTILDGWSLGGHWPRTLSQTLQPQGPKGGKPSRGETGTGA